MLGTNREAKTELDQIWLHSKPMAGFGKFKLYVFVRVKKNN